MPIISKQKIAPVLLALSLPGMSVMAEDQPASGVSGKPETTLSSSGLPSSGLNNAQFREQDRSRYLKEKEAEWPRIKFALYTIGASMLGWIAIGLFVKKPEDPEQKPSFRDGKK